jgi:hypothetical protein
LPAPLAFFSLSKISTPKSKLGKLIPLRNAMEDNALQPGARSRVEVLAKVVPLTATDQRHSYIKRPHTLAGPGAYSIPSTFRQSAINTLLRAVQREHYGREFARYGMRSDAMDQSD